MSAARLHAPLLCPRCERHVRRLGVPCPCEQTCHACGRSCPVNDAGLCGPCLSYGTFETERAATVTAAPPLKWTGKALDRLLGAIFYHTD